MSDRDNQIANAIAKTFIQRTDIKSWQQKNGDYHIDRTPITRADLLAHISGERTMGHYPVAPDGLCKFFCFDLDLTEPDDPERVPEPKVCRVRGEEVNPRAIFSDRNDERRLQLLGMLKDLASVLARRTHSLLGLPVLASFSGSKGLHVYGLTGKVPAADAREAAWAILEDYKYFAPIRGENFWGRTDLPQGEKDIIEIEVFPKQDTVGVDSQVGNLIRLPLGINRKSGNQGAFIYVDGHPGKMTKCDPLVALGGELPWTE